MSKPSLSIFKERFYPVSLAATIILIVSFLTRVALLIKSGANFDWTAYNLMGSFLIGFFFDLAMISYYILPLVLYIWLMPDKWYRTKWNRIIQYGYFLIIGVMVSICLTLYVRFKRAGWL